MRPRTLVAAIVVVGALGGVVTAGLITGGGTFEEAWVSDTPRENLRNHHPVGVGPEADLVVAPVTEVPGDDVEMTDRSCVLAGLAPEEGTVLWRATTPAEDCFSHALTEPAIADIDDDGRREAAVASTEDSLSVYDARTGEAEWRVPLSTYGYGRPTIGDIHPETGRDVVVSDIGGNLVLASGNGTVLWRIALNRTLEGRVTVYRAPVVGDLTGDGEQNILVGTNRGLVVLSADGELLWSRGPSARYLSTTRSPDGSPLVVTAYHGGIRAVDGASGEPVWKRDVTNGRIRAAADGDGDGTPEVYVGRVGGEVLALDAHTGGTEWSTTVSTDEDVIVPPPRVADVNGDGRPEILAATEAGRVVALDPGSGDELAAYEREVPVWTFPTPADIDHDGTAEVLIRYGDGRVVALTYADRGLGPPVGSVT